MGGHQTRVLKIHQENQKCVTERDQNLISLVKFNAIHRQNVNNYLHRRRPLRSAPVSRPNQAQVCIHRSLRQYTFKTKNEEHRNSR